MFITLFLVPIIQYILCNYALWLNTDLFIDIWVNKKNQKRLFNCLKERIDLDE